MPPEQFGGRAAPASDLYSLGATLIYLLWMGTRRCEIRGTQAELDWLAYELSNWLDLPVTKTSSLTSAFR